LVAQLLTGGATRLVEFWLAVDADETKQSLLAFESNCGESNFLLALNGLR